MKNIIETKKFLPAEMLIHLTNQFNPAAVAVEAVAFESAFDSAMREYTSMTQGGDADQEYNTDVLAVAYLTLSALFVNNPERFEYWRSYGYKTCLSARAEKRAGQPVRMSSHSKSGASNKRQISPMTPSEQEPDPVTWE